MTNSGEVSRKEYVVEVTNVRIPVVYILSKGL